MMDWTMLANLGVPLLILAAVGWALWKIVVYLGRKLFGTDEKPGYIGQVVADFRAFLETLVARLELIMSGQQTQQTICERHADLMESVSVSLAESSLSQQASVVALLRLVEIHEQPQGVVMQATHHLTEMRQDIDRGKQALRLYCQICREVSAREFPNSAAEVARHCDEIEKTINEA